MKWNLLASLAALSLLILGLVLPTLAQDNAPLDGHYLVQAESGSLSDNGDGTYSLTLEGVPAEIYWLVNQPEPFLGQYDALVLAAEWGSNPDNLQTAGLFSVGDLTAEVSLSLPTYDEMLEEMTFVVTVNAVYNLSATEADAGNKKNQPELPAEFEAAALAIQFDGTFESGLVVGARILEEEGRVPRGEQANRPAPPRGERAERPTPAP